MTARVRSSWPAFALAVVFLVANWPLVSGRECPPFDAFSAFGVYHHVVGAFARAGRWMSWNPWSSAGSPDYADPQFGAFSPFVVVTAYLANGAEVGFRVYWLLEWYLGGLGLIVLGRHLRAPRWGCFGVASAYLFCGFYTGHAEHTVSTYAFSALPWTIWRADLAMGRGRLIDAAQAGALLGLSALGGYPGVVIGNASCTTLWTLGRALTSSSRPTLLPRLTRWAAVVAIIATVSGIVAAVTYVPFFVDAAGYSGRTGPLRRDVAVRNGAYLPSALETFASPAIASLDFGVDPDPSLRSVYLGTLVPALALAALCRRRRLWRWWIAGMAALSLACALSTIVPLRGWLYDCCFPFRYFRQASLFRGYLLFCVAVLALYGCRDLAACLRRPATPRLRTIVAIVACPATVALVVCSVVFSSMRPEFTRSVHEHAIVMWLLPPAILLSAARLSPRVWRAVIIASIVTIAASDAIWSAALSGPLLHATNDGWYRASELRYQGLDLTSRGLARGTESLDNHNVWQKQPVLRSYTPFQNAWFERLSRDRVFERAATQADRIFFAPDAPRVVVDERILAALVARADALNAPVIVAHDAREVLSRAAPTDPATIAGDAARVSALPAARPIAVHVDRYVPDELTLSLTAPSAGWLLVTDRWARGWGVTVNGSPTTLYVGDFVFRAVPVPIGRIQVRFSYEKSHGVSLVALSWGTCALLLIAVPLAKLSMRASHA